MVKCEDCKKEVKRVYRVTLMCILEVKRVYRVTLVCILGEKQVRICHECKKKYPVMHFEESSDGPML